MAQPIGFHRNQGGEANEVGPIGEYISQLAAAGLRPVMCCVDEAGTAVEVADAGGLAVYAKDAWRAPPDYNQSPEDAAAERWAGIRDLIPPEIRAARDRIWIEILNEPDKERAPFVFAFMVELARLADFDAYRVCGPSWSTGTPEVAEWETPEGLAWLRRCAERPEQSAVALHEYSLDADDIETGSPWLVGRFTFTQDICDTHGIDYPQFIITECGWTYNDMPDSVAAMAQLPWLAEMYGDIPFCLWTVGNWDKGPNLPPKLAAIVDDVTEYVLANYETEEPDPDPEPEPIPWQRTVWEASIKEQKERGITLNPDHGVQRMIFAREGYTPVTRETSVQVGEDVYGYQAAEHLETGERIVLAFERPWPGPGGVEVLTEDDMPEPEPETFAWRAWPTDYKVVTQTFGARPEYYSQFGLPGHEGADLRAPLDSPIYAIDAGTVYLVTGNEGNYGKQIRIQHADGYVSVYAHNNETLVQEGQRVRAGQLIAKANSTGNSQGHHLHLTLKRDGHNAPGYPSNIIDPTEHILPHKPSFPGLPSAEHGLTFCDISHHQRSVNFAEMMRRGVYACYLRASIGGGGLDNIFETAWPAIAQTPMARGIYHLYKSDSTPEQNLHNLIGVVQKYRHGDLRIAIDVEPVLGVRVNGDDVARFFDMFRDSFGYDPLAYTGLWILHSDHSYGDMSWMGRELLWLASYRNSPPQTGEFPPLPEGGELNRLLAHQWTSSLYDGRRWGVESSGLDINVAYDLNRLLIEPVEPTPPPPKPKVDLLPYLRTESGRLYELRRQDGSQERVQCAVDQDRFFYTKGTGGIDGKAEWEELRADLDWIYRGIDTSPGSGRYYELRDDPKQKWSRWAPRRMHIGQEYVRKPWVIFRRKEDCAEIGRGQQQTSIKLEAVHRQWTSPHGITLDNVAQVAVFHAGGSLFERYYYAQGYSLVGFKGESVQGYISEVHEPGQRPDNQREEIDCL